MKRTPMIPDLDSIPATFHSLMKAAPVFDSSCSAIAKVFYIEKDGGLFLKTAEAGTLKQEAQMDAYFHSLGLGPEVLEYRTEGTDWLLTRRVPGEDCIHEQYLAEPAQLAETLGEILYDLHHRDHTGCPVQNHTERYIARAKENYAAKRYDTSLFPDNWGYATPEEAWAVVTANAKYLKTDTLLHGDYCLPNIVLDHWQFSGFIDLDTGGVGDRHVDLFWGMWSLQFNLKTDRYRERFLDAYGRDGICEDAFRTVAAVEVFG